MITHVKLKYVTKSVIFVFSYNYYENNRAQFKTQIYCGIQEGKERTCLTTV